MQSAQPYLDSFKAAMDNDLNTSLALTEVYNVLKADITDATKVYLIEKFDYVLGLDLLNPKKKEQKSDDALTKEIEDLIEKRTLARQNKDWATADSIRDRLKEMHVVVKDTPNGIEWHIEN